MSGRLRQSVVQFVLDMDADNVVKGCLGCEAERKGGAGIETLRRSQGFSSEAVLPTDDVNANQNAPPPESAGTVRF
jgi:hypothetical protein